MFVDGSSEASKFNGEYAVVWGLFVPGSVHKCQTEVLAFQMHPSHTIQSAEVAVLTESLIQAKKKMFRVTREFMAAEPHPSTLKTSLRSPLKINIFSDCQSNTPFLRRPNWAGGNRAKLELFQRCVDESYNALDLFATLPASTSD